MNDTSLNDWLSFACVVEEKGFTAAAKKLGLSPSIISKRITALEKNLGARLLQRNTRSLILTEAGESFYQRCRQIKIEVEKAKNDVSVIQEKPRGTLRIQAPMSFGQEHLVLALQAFMQQYPDIEVDLTLSNQLPNLIESGQDFAISIKDLPDSRYVAKRIATRSIGVYGSPEYFEKYGIPSTPQALAYHNCLCYRSPTTKQDWHFIDLEKNTFSVKVKGNFRANSSQALLRATIAGLGIAKLPSFMVNHELAQEKLVRVLKSYCRQAMGIYVIYPDKSLLAAKTRLLIDFLSEYFLASPQWEE